MQGHIVMKVLGQTYGVTVGSTVTSLPSIPTSAIRARVQVESNDIRARFDSTSSVTSGVGGGVLLPVNTIALPEHVIDGYDKMKAMRMVMDGSTASSLNVVYEGEGEVI